MRRRLFTLLSAVSLALCIVTVALWVHGGRWSQSDAWREVRPLTTTRLAVGWGQGAVRLDVLTPAADPVPQGRAGLLGFGYFRTGAYARPAGGGPGFRLGDIRSAFVPFWFVAAETAALPLWRAVAAVRARSAIRPGHCPACGYDLRASPGRCPECGSEPKGAT